GNCIGRGQFGSVYRSLNLSTGQMVAIKRIRLHGMEEAEVRDVMREVELLKRLAHPSIVKYEGMSRDEEYLNIVLEFVENGSLGQTLKAFGNFNEKLVSSYVAKILEGLDYLHSQGVVHCDLKAANILSTKNGNVKLSDFGVSLNMKAVENIRQDATQGKTTSRDVAGTPNWMAPEVISLNGASPASDIWSLGCTIIELLTGKPPYAEITNSMSVLFRIVEDEMPPLPDVSPDLEDFLKLCFIKDPKHRPEAVVLFEHPWVKKLNPEIVRQDFTLGVPYLTNVSGTTTTG
ncbi:kinase-like domain-containing protein, partial [Naematelia encephala]